MRKKEPEVSDALTFTILTSPPDGYEPVIEATTTSTRQTVGMIADNQDVIKEFRSRSPNDLTRSNIGGPTTAAELSAAALNSGTTSPFGVRPPPAALEDVQREQARRRRRVIIGSALWLSFVGVVLVVFIVKVLTADLDISPAAALAYSKRRQDRHRMEHSNNTFLPN